MLELQGPAFGNLRQTFGGDTLNTAVYLARCGGSHLRVHYATALGDDSLSAGLLERWAAEGVQTGLVQRLPGRLPGLYLIELDEGPMFGANIVDTPVEKVAIGMPVEVTFETYDGTTLPQFRPATSSR